jgi:hypothetical protein
LPGVGVVDESVEPVLLTGPDLQLAGFQGQLGAHVADQGPADGPAAASNADSCCGPNEPTDPALDRSPDDEHP